MTFRFVVPGDPVPKARARTGRYGNTYTPRKTVEYELVVGLEASKEMLKAGLQALNSKDLRFEVELVFYLETDRRIDLDNLQKSILDGLTPRKPRGRARGVGLFWRDDSQIDRILARKGRAVPGQGCALVTVNWGAE